MFIVEIWVEILQYLTYSQCLECRLIDKYVNSIINEHMQLHITIKDEESCLFSQRVKKITSLSTSYIDDSIVLLIESQKKLKKLEFFSEGYKPFERPFEIPLNNINIKVIEKLVISFSVFNKSEIIVPDSLHIKKLELSCGSFPLIDFLKSNAKIDQITIKKTDTITHSYIGKRSIHCLKFCTTTRFREIQHNFDSIDYLILDFRIEKFEGKVITVLPWVKNIIVKVNTMSLKREILSFKILGEKQNIIILDESGDGDIIVDVSGAIKNLYVFAKYCTIQKVESRGLCHIFTKKLYTITLTFVEWLQEEIKREEFGEKMKKFQDMYTKIKS